MLNMSDARKSHTLESKPHMTPITDIVDDHDLISTQEHTVKAYTINAAFKSVTQSRPARFR